MPRPPWLLTPVLALLLASPAVVPVRAKSRFESAGACRLQKPLSFLVRRNMLKARVLDPGAHTRSVRWRAETYGHVPGLGLDGYNPKPVANQVRTTRFFGLPITLHEKVIPTLACVERTISHKCRSPKDRYVPHAIGGLRTANTYHKGEVSNHLFGIAIDIDPDRNPCCHCVEPWPQHTACRKEAQSVYERTELTRCWIDSFEQHGFYWLGHDQLEDTMHFEYLADPDRKERPASAHRRPAARRGAKAEAPRP